MYRLADVRKYIRGYELQIEDRPTNYIQICLIGLNTVVKIAKIYGMNEMRRYMSEN